MYMYSHSRTGLIADLPSLNVTSVFFITFAFLGQLETSTKGRAGASASVINISSIAALVKLPLLYVSMVCYVWQSETDLYMRSVHMQH